MLIISAGMQKAGTAYFYNLLRLLVLKSGGADANEIKQHEGLSDVMKWANNNVGKLDAAKVLKLWWISIKHGSYVVKTHGGYISKWLKFPIRIGGLRVLYIYRDPRDVLVSMQDHGNRIREKGDNHTFARFDNFEKAYERVQRIVKVWSKYNEMEGVKMIRFEDLIGDPLKTLMNSCNYLNISVEERELEIIINEIGSKKSGLHFNRGVSGRFREVLSDKQISLFEEEMGDTIRDMGYQL